MRFANLIKPQLILTKHEMPQGIFYLRESLLVILLRISVLIGFLLIIPGVYTAIITGRFIPVVVQIALFIALIINYQLKSLSYNQRSIILLAIIYLTVLLLAQTNILLFLTELFWISFILLSTILFGFTSGIITATLSSFSILLGIIFPIQNFGIPINTENWSTQWVSALPEIIFFYLTTIVISFVVALAVEIFEKNLDAIGQKLSNIQENEKRSRDKNRQYKKLIEQFKMAVEISQIANKILEPALLLNEAVQLIQQYFNLNYVGIYLVDEIKEFAELRAQIDDTGTKAYAHQPRHVIGDSSITGQAIQTKQAIIAKNTEIKKFNYEITDCPQEITELSLPLIAGKDAIGAITVQSMQSHKINEFDIQILQNIADSLAIAIQNSLVFEHLENNIAEIEALNRQYIQTGWTGHLNDYVRLQHTFESQAKPVENQSGEIYTTPLFVREQIIGELVVENDSGFWSKEEVSLIQAIAAQAAQALENARLLQETQQKALQEQLLGNFSNVVRESFDIDAILRTAIRELGDNLNLEEVSAIVGWENE